MRSSSKNRSMRQGFTLVEVLVASGVSVIVMSLALAVFLMVAGTWARGEGLIDGENDTRIALRVISDELREAMWVNIDANGMGLTYRKPLKDSSGNFMIPVTWDGLDRRIEMVGGRLFLESTASDRRVIARNILSTDPFLLTSHSLQAKRQSGAPPTAPAYRIFNANAGAITTSVTVQLVVGKRGANSGEQVRSRKRETVVLRNVPELIK
ncbi:prepilin-type N-terminal cleavage/methylation domain-containing protein [Geitlerinema splendidum]|nr:prepilin-type N-terminal cleavage/methylation domain-containing protein [Geitlerinema splendidum]